MCAGGPPFCITDAEGQYEFAGVSPGRYNLRIYDPQGHYPDTEQPVDATGGDPPPVVTRYWRVFLALTQ